MFADVCVQRGELPLDRARSPQLRSLLHSAAQGSNGPVTTDEDKSDRSAAESDADADDDDGLFSPASGTSLHACNSHPNVGGSSNSNGTSSSTKAATETRPVVNGDANGAHKGAHPHSRRHDLIGKKHSYYK